MTIALLGAGVLGASAYAVSQAPAYGGNQAPAYNTYNGGQGPGYGGNQAPANNAAQAQPGAVNYVEGAAQLDGRPLNRRDVGRASIDPGSVLATEAGKAEVLLTPGVFLRLDDHSAVKMISPDLTKTQIEVVQGRAAVEVDQIFPQNDLEIIDAGVATQLLKPGFYEFNANQPTALVFAGKAEVREGDGRYKEIKDHHEMALAQNVKEKSVNFDARDAQDEFYNWSSLRSQYLSEANGQIAGQYAGVEGFNPGWYWDPYMWDYTFIGMGPYWSPFGFGFYPPWGWYGGYWGGGFFGGRYYGRGFRGGVRSGSAFHGSVGGGFHGGGFRGGGFGGGGGFHGGGGGGGGHR
ncbi:MAG TPA: hypothetical protein VGG56_05175 [Terracidiphilus sp.]